MKLPIEKFKEEIVRTITNSPITIIEGTTACGKSSKVPVYLAEAGYKVIITQPRRLAATALAEKVAKGFGKQALGNEVGFHTGLKSNFSNDSQIIYMTEGTELIRQFSSKEDLDNTVLIIDEFHERKSDADVLLAFAKKLITENGKNLKLVLMSATINSDQLSVFLDNAPIIKITTPLYQVITLHYPTKDMNDIILRSVKANNNILVFLPGKQEIMHLRQELIKLFRSYGVHARILALHSDLPYEEQKLVFQHSRPKVILATNIAQTSITISDIDIVIDTGLEKRVEIVDGIPTLITKQISKSDCIQRRGRVGRSSPGVYYLCSDFPYENRDEYPTPEIEVSSLEDILLLLTNFNISIDSLPFLDAPTSHLIEKSIQLLEKLGAIDKDGNITDIGAQMCQIPLGVRSSRMIVEAKKYGIEADMLICGLIQEIGKLGDILSIGDSCRSEQYISDLVYQLNLFKSAYFDSNVYTGSMKLTFDHMVEYADKVSTKLGVTITPNEPDISTIKKCLISGFPDCLFILEKGKGYINSSHSSSRIPYRNSFLSKGGHKYLIGIPMDFASDVAPDKVYQRILLPTSYSKEELLEVSDYLFTKKYVMKENVIYQYFYYNDIEIASFSLGTIAELRESDPYGFYENSEYYPKFKQSYKFLYYHGFKIASL